MRLFYVTEPVEARVTYDRVAKRFLAVLDGTPAAVDGAPAAPVRLLPANGPAPTAGEIYFGTGLEWNPLAHALAAAGRGAALKLLSEAATARVMRTPGLPPRLGYVHALGKPFIPLESQLDGLHAGPAPRVAVVNFLHHAFGDAIVSLTVLRELRLRLERRFGARPRIDLFQNDYVPGVEALYRRSGLCGAVRRLPAPLSELAAYDAYFDFSVAAYNLEKPWTDALLETVGVDPATVPPDRKRNRLALAPRARREVEPAVEEARARGGPVLLFHPLASTPLRSCPPGRAVRFVHEVLERTPWTVACATPLGAEHNRVVDWSVASRSFDHFMALIAASDAFVAADTSVYHVADAFDVPGVVVFTTVAPEQRVGPYPLITGIDLRSSGLPAGPHEDDDPAKAAVAAGLWEEMDTDVVLAALEGTVGRRRESVKRMGPPDCAAAAAQQSNSAVVPAERR